MDIINSIDNTTIIESFRTDSPKDCKQILGNISKQTTVICQNIRSIRKNLDYFIIFISRLQFSPDVIVLTECWLDDTFGPIDIPNYLCHYSNVYLNQNDGIVIYTKGNLTVNIQEPQCCDANCLLINIASSLTIVAIYRSPSVKDICKFLASLEVVLSNINGPAILTGDLNIDIKLGSTDSRAIDYLDLTSHYGFIPGHLLPTRGPNCLDHALIKSKAPARVVVCDSDVTDHDTIIIGLDRVSMRTSKSRFIKKTNFPSLVSDLEHVDWSPVFAESDVSSATALFIEKVTSCMQNNTHSIKLRSAEFLCKPWMTNSVLKCVRKRETMHMEYKKNPKDTSLHVRYINYRNNCDSLLKNLKHEYERKSIHDSCGNSKNLWKTIKNICSIRCSNPEPYNLLKSKPTALESANHANHFFSSVGKELADNILSRLNTSEEHLTKKICSGNNSPLNSFFLAPTDGFEVSKILSGLKTSSAPGWDGIRNDVLKCAKHVLAVPIAHICNLSMLTGTVPDCLKTADVSPIYKAGESTSVTNYRPISLLPTLSKVLEKVINRRLLAYLETNCLLSPNQFGFRQCKSTDDGVSTLVDTIIEKLDSGKKCIGVFLDLAKAFDTVSRPILLRKLELLGIRGLPLEWFRSYLSGRKQRVRVGDTFSEYASVEFGVPQGSVLGPTLFLTYINDLCNLKVSQTKIIAFADDTALIFHGNDWSEVCDVAQKGLHVVAHWLQNNLLTLNTSKTKFLAFRISERTRPDTPIHLRLHYCDSFPSNRSLCACPVIEQVNHIKYLGIIIDHHLSWTYQIDALYNRLRKMLHIFKRLGAVSDPATVRIVYLALCQSILSYGIVCWGTAAKTLLLKLERAQRAILKVAYRKPYRYSTDKLYSDTNHLRVRQLFIMATTLRYHKIARYAAVEPLKSSRRNTWNIPLVKTVFAQKSFAFKGPFIYRTLDRLLHIINDSRSTCKRKICHLLGTLGYEETENLLKVVK